MKLVLLIISFILIVNTFAHSEDIYVFDKKIDIPLKGATVHFTCLEGRCKDSTQVKHTSTIGKVVNPFKEKSQIFISFIGYERFVDTLDAGFSGDIFLNPSSIMMQEVVTTGSFVPTTAQKSIYPVEVVNRERIESQAAMDLGDILNNELNMRIGQDGILGSSLSINGVSGQNVKILIDGVPMIGRLNGNIDISQINLNNTERVEIIEGPMSTIYGTDALGGVINIITKEPVCERVEGNINSYYEGVGTYNFDGNLLYSIDNHSFSISGGRYFFDGFSVADTSRRMDWKPKEQYFTDWQYSYDLGDLRFRYTGRYFRELILNRGNLRPPYFETAFDDKYYTNRLTNALFAQGKLADDKYIDFTVSYSNFNRIKNTFIKDMVTLDERLTADPADQDTSDFNAWLIRGVFSHDEITPFLSYQAGVDINMEEALGKRIEGITQFVGDYATFLSTQFKITPAFLFQPAVRLIHNTNYEAPVVPSVNIKYDMTDKHSLRASYSRGFRAPTPRELYFFFVDINHNIRGNQDLKAENSHSFNLAVNYNNEQKHYVFRLEPKFFYNQIQDLITLAVVQGDLYSYVNVGQFETVGGSFTLSYLRPDITSKVGVSYIGTSNQVNAEDAPTFNFTPEVQANISYDIPGIDTKIAFFYKYTGKQPGFLIDENDDLIEFFNEDYSMMDATLSKSFYDNMLEFSVGVKNLFNITNINRSNASASANGGVHSGGNSSLPIGFGRTFFAQLNIHLR